MRSIGVPRRPLLFRPFVGDQFQEPVGDAARAACVAVDEAQLRHARVEQLALLVVDFVEKVDARRGQFAEHDAHGEQLVVVGRAVVFGLHLEDGHHDAPLLDFGKGHAQIAEQFAARGFVVTDVVRMVADGHLVGVFVPHADLAIVTQHGA